MDKIDAVWMFVCIDEDGNQRIPSKMMGDVSYPLMTTKQSLLPAIKKVAQKVAREANMEIRLLKFSNGELVETIKPEIDDGNH